MSENLFCFFPPKMGFSGHFDSFHWDLGLGLGQVTQPFGSSRSFDPDQDPNPSFFEYRCLCKYHFVEF
jgi:hypothetical protein